MPSGEKVTNFYQKTKKCQNILVMDLGFLGDSIHAFPALWEIRRAFPEAKLSVMVSEHIKGLLKVLPWVDEILGYPRFPKGPKWYEDLGRVWQMRRKGYDAIINLNGSDRSSILTWCTGAKYRLGRIPPKPSAFWKHCFTDTTDYPRGNEPIYKQEWACLKNAGFPISEAPEFHIEIPEDKQIKAKELTSNDEHYVHVSPFTTLDRKELPLPVMIDFFNELKQKYPKLKLALSCAPNEREQEKFDQLLQGLNFTPWRTFRGNLNLMELAAIIQRSILHIGGDSGAIHVALMTGVRTLSWFREYENKREWMPIGEGHAHVIGESTEAGLKGINPKDLIDAFESLIPACCK